MSENKPDLVAELARLKVAIGLASSGDDVADYAACVGAADAAYKFLRAHCAEIEVMARKAAEHDLFMGRMYADVQDGFIRRITTELVPGYLGEQAMHNSAREG